MSTSTKSNPDEIVWEVHEDKKSWWKQRSGLEQKLMISFGITVVVFLGIFIYMSLKPTSVQETIVCSTTECLVSASQIINSIDTNINPCDDFYHFACRKLIKDTSDEEIKEEIVELIQEPISVNDNFMVKSQKALFQSCMNEEELEDESLPVVQNVIKDLGEWPVVVGKRWNEKGFDWADMVIKLRKKGFDDSMVLTVSLSKTKTKIETTVMPPFIHEVKRERSELYIRYMSDVARLFGAEPNRATMEMEKVYDFREKLLEITDKFWGWNTTRATISDFQEEYDEIDWFKFIYNFVNPHKIGSKDYVEFPNPDFMDAFSILMSKTHQRIQANYIIWTVIEGLMPFLPKSYRELQDNYTCALDDGSQNKERSKLCLDIVEDLFVPVPAHVLYMRKHLTEEKQEKILQIFESIKLQTITYFDEIQWITDVDKENIVNALNETSPIIGIEGNYSDDSIFEKHSIGINKRTYGGSFLNMYLNKNRQMRETKMRNIGKEENYLLDNLITYTSPIILPETSKMILPIGMLPKMYYELESPMYLTYGNLGKAIGEELVRELVQERYKDYNFSNTSNKGFEESIKCILKSFMSNSKDELITNFIDWEVYANVIANRIAYDAYQKWVEENGEEPVPVGIDYTTNQLFWIAVLSDECYDKKELLYLTFQKYYEKNIPLINDENFANDFGCSTESKMYPSEKCGSMQ